jgi:methionine-gamma-lyase
LYVAENLRQLGVRVFYPGLSDNPSHELMKKLMNPQFGFGGMLAIDAQTSEEANALMGAMQESKVGYLAVSLGYFKTLFSAPGHSTSSEIPHDERDAMGLSDGLVRISIGLDNDIETSLSRIKACLERVGLC